jgi:type I restriction enzyme S subunit
MSSEFQRSKLEALVTFSNGRSSPDRFEDGAFPVYGSNGLIGLANEVNAPAQSIVIGRVGSYCGSVHFSWTECWVTDNAIRATAKGNNDSSFLYYLLKHLDLNNWRSGSGQPLLNQATLNSIEVSVPPPSDQKRIGGFIASLDDRITLLRETNATLEAIAQALFKSWFVDFDPVRAKAEGRARQDGERSGQPRMPQASDLPRPGAEAGAEAQGQPQGMDAATAALFPDSFEESELGLVPKGWAVCSLDSIADYLNGLALQKFPPSEDSWLPVIKIAQLRKGDTVGADRAGRNIKPEYVIQNGDVLFSWSGSLEVVIWCGGEGALNQHLFKVTSAEFPKWFYYLWTRHHLPDFQQTAASKATTMGHIQRKHLTEAKVIVPPAEVLQQAGAFIAPLLDRWLSNAEQAQTLTQLRDTLLPRLISGQLRLPEAQAQLEA